MGGAGFALGLGALSQAFSDSMKGLNEGQEERRKEEVLGMQQRKAITEEAFAPIEYEGAQLRNTTARQNLELAKQENQRANDRAAREASMFGPEFALRTAQAARAGTEAKYAEQQIQSDLSTALKNRELTEENLKKARAEFPFLVPSLEAERNKRDLEIRILKQKTVDIEQKRARREKAGAVLLAAGYDLNQIARVLAEFGGDIDPDDVYLQFLKARLAADAHALGNDNPFKKHQIMQLSQRAAEDDSNREADKMLTLAYGPLVVKEGIEPGLDLSRAWFQQYAKARGLMASENPQLGIVFPPSLKAIQPMHPELISALAKNVSSFDSILGTNAGREAALDIYSRMNAYVTQGIDWTRAKMLAAEDHQKALGGEKTLSDSWAVKKDTRGILGKALDNIKESFSSSLGSGAPATVSPDNKRIPTEVDLPPKAKDTRLESPEDARIRRLNELSGEEGYTWDQLKNDPAWRAHIEAKYKRKYGVAP